MLRLCLSALVCVASPMLSLSAQEVNQTPEAVRISEFSGKPVPRFESLKFAAANGRTGPSTEHPVKWQYARQGLPMLIVKETNDWRRVRDPDGEEVWLHVGLLSPELTGMIRRETLLRRRPEPDSAGLAMLEKGVIGTIGACEAGWCAFAAGSQKGHVPEADIWGADASEDKL